MKMRMAERFGGDAETESKTTPMGKGIEIASKTPIPFGHALYRQWESWEEKRQVALQMVHVLELRYTEIIDSYLTAYGSRDPERMKAAHDELGAFEKAHLPLHRQVTECEKECTKLVQRYWNSLFRLKYTMMSMLPAPPWKPSLPPGLDVARII